MQFQFYLDPAEQIQTLLVMDNPGGLVCFALLFCITNMTYRVKQYAENHK
jgi:hypothetical protein